MSSTSIIAYVIFTSAIGYAFLYPSFGEVANLSAEKQKYEDSLATVNNIETKKNELLAQFNNITDEEKKSINTILPNSLDLVTLLSQIDAVASKYGIKIDKISSVNQDSSVGDSIETAGPDIPYKSTLVSFSFEASYETFRNFISSLEKSLRILDIRALKLDTTENSNLYSYTVEFETYFTSK